MFAHVKRIFDLFNTASFILLAPVLFPAVMIHELCHYAGARVVGSEVTEFSVSPLRPDKNYICTPHSGVLWKEVIISFAPPLIMWPIGYAILQTGEPWSIIGVVLLIGGIPSPADVLSIPGTKEGRDRLLA